jgi:hypothetical protein
MNSAQSFGAVEACEEPFGCAGGPWRPTAAASRAAQEHVARGRARAYAEERRAQVPRNGPSVCDAMLPTWCSLYHTNAHAGHDGAPPVLSRRCAAACCRRRARPRRPRARRPRLRPRRPPRRLPGRRPVQLLAPARLRRVRGHDAGRGGHVEGRQAGEVCRVCRQVWRPGAARGRLQGLWQVERLRHVEPQRQVERQRQVEPLGRLERLRVRWGGPGADAQAGGMDSLVGSCAS